MLKSRIFDELWKIRNELAGIKEMIQCRQTVKDGITVATLYSTLPYSPTEVSFELYHHDWLRLEQSEEWKGFCKLLEEVQTGYKKMLQQETRD